MKILVSYASGNTNSYEQKLEFGHEVMEIGKLNTNTISAVIKNLEGEGLVNVVILNIVRLDD